MESKIKSRNIKRTTTLHFKVNIAELNSANLLAAYWGVNLSECLRRCVIEAAERNGVFGALFINNETTSPDAPLAGSTDEVEQETEARDELEPTPS